MRRLICASKLALPAIVLLALAAPAWCQVVVVAQGTNGPAYGDDEGTAKYVYEVIKPKYIGALALAQLFGGQIISLNADVMRGNYGFGGNMGNGGRRGGYGGIASNNRGGGWGNG